MKRHPALQDLSRDHFHVLFWCQRLRRALQRGAPWSEVQALVDGFLAFFRSDMSPHFEEEDLLVVPPAAQAPTLEAVARTTLEEHVSLRRRIEELRLARDSEAETRRLLRDLEPVVTAHVHMEEEELFEGMQKALSEDELQRIGAASLEFRRRKRAPDAIGPRPGRG